MGEWKRLWVDGELQCAEGRPYVFAIQLMGGLWDYFVDAVVWDSENPAEWRNAESGWNLEDVTHFAELKEPSDG